VAAHCQAQGPTHSSQAGPLCSAPSGLQKQGQACLVPFLATFPSCPRSWRPSTVEVKQCMEVPGQMGALRLSQGLSQSFPTQSPEQSWPPGPAPLHLQGCHGLAGLGPWTAFGGCLVSEI
jgi:hypothetical protein